MINWFIKVNRSGYQISRRLFHDGQIQTTVICLRVLEIWMLSSFWQLYLTLVITSKYTHGVNPIGFGVLHIHCAQTLTFCQSLKTTSHDFIWKSNYVRWSNFKTWRQIIKMIINLYAASLVISIFLLKRF